MSLLRKLQSGLSCILFLAIVVIICSHLLYLYSTLSPTVPSLSHLHGAFKKPTFAPLVGEVQSSPYGIIRAECLQCVEQFMQYVAVQHGLQVVERDIRGMGIQSELRSALWAASLHFEGLVEGLVEAEPRVYAFYVDKDNIDNFFKAYLGLIQEKQPQSRIYLVSESKIKVKGFKALKNAELLNFQDNLVQLLTKQAKIPKSISQAYVNYYNSSIPLIFQKITKDSKDLDKALGPFNVPVEPSKKAERVLSELCSEGAASKIKSAKLGRELRNVGAAVVDGETHWRDDRYRLNYMIKTGQNCVQGVIVQEEHEQQAQGQEKCSCKCDEKVLSNEKNNEQRQITPEVQATDEDQGSEQAEVEQEISQEQQETEPSTQQAEQQESQKQDEDPITQQDQQQQHEEPQQHVEDPEQRKQAEQDEQALIESETAADL